MVDKYGNDIKILAQQTFKIYTLKLREDQILHAHVASGGKWDSEDYKILFPMVGEMLNFRKAPLLLTYDKFVFPSAEASAYWANPETTCPYFNSEALIMDSLPLKILGNFYLKFNKPLRPTRIFDAEKNAIPWLRTFM